MSAVAGYRGGLPPVEVLGSGSFVGVSHIVVLMMYMWREKEVSSHVPANKGRTGAHLSRG